MLSKLFSFIARNYPLKHSLSKLLIVLFLLVVVSSKAQSNHQWWYDIHHHDGVTPWERYLILSPAFFGPNAFPVPENNQGLINSKLEIETALEGHYNSHEQTHNLFSKIFIPLLKEKVGLQLSIVPFELFQYDSLIRDTRFSRNYEGKGFAYGDLYIGTQIQLFKNHEVWPDVLISINLRTASGNEFGSARFADSPGYYFLLSSGKSIPLNTKAFTSLRFYGMLGFYAWQTNLAGHFQDDAVIYGFGIKLDSKHFSVSTDLDGFSGYLKNGDRPLVYRFRALTSMDSNINYGLQFEHGIVDYNFRSLRFSFIYSIESDK